MSHIPAIVNAVMELILALGATACFAILIYHIENYQVWGRTSEATMIGLLVILAYVETTTVSKMIILIKPQACQLRSLCLVSL